jgi:hypothetical protein
MQRALPLLLRRFLLGIEEDPGLLPRCHPGAADASRITGKSKRSGHQEVE